MAPEPLIHDVFVSYAHEDADFVGRLAGALTAVGKNAWIDDHRLLPSAQWRRKVEEAIRTSRGFVFVLTPDSLESRECAAELEHARTHGKRIVPIHLVDVDDERTPQTLRDLHWLRARGEDIDSVAERLAETLDLDLEWVDAHTDLLRRAAAWEQAGRKRGLLLRGVELRQAAKALELGERHSTPAVTSLQREFVAAGHRAARRRRLRVLSMALVAVAAAVVGGGLALRAREQALARGLAFLADQQLESDPERGLLLALWAYDVRPNWETEAVVRQATAESRISRTLRGHAGAVFGATFSPDGQRIVSAGQDGRVVVRDGRGRLVTAFQLAAQAVVARFSPDSRRLAVGDGAGSVHVWRLDRRTRSTVLSIKHGSVLDLDFHPTEPLLAVATADGTVALRDLDGRRDTGLRGHRGRVVGVDFSTDGRRLLSAGDDGTIRSWDVERGRGRRLVDVGSRLYGVDLSPDGRHLTAAADDGRLRIWTSGGRRLTQIETTTGFTEASFDPTGRQVVISSVDGSAYAWDWETHEPTAELRGEGSPLLDAQYSPDGASVVTAGADGAVRIWRPRAPVILRSGHRGVNAAQWTPDGDRIVAGGEDGRMVIWAWPSLRRLVSFERHRGPIGDAMLSGDGSRVISAGAADGRVFVWSATTGDVIASWRMRGAASVALSRDGRRAAAGDASGGVQVWDVDARTATGHVRTDGPVTALAFSSDARSLALGSGVGVVRIWNVAERRPDPTVELRGHTGAVNDIHFSDNGNAAITAGADRTVRTWSVIDGKQLTVGRYHNAQVLSVDATRLGDLRVSGSTDGYVVASLTGARGTGNVLIAKHVNATTAVDIHPDENLVLSASATGAAEISPCECGSIEEVLRVARTRVSRSLTDEERRVFGEQARRL